MLRLYARGLGLRKDDLWVLKELIKVCMHRIMLLTLVFDTDIIIGRRLWLLDELARWNRLTTT